MIGKRDAVQKILEDSKRQLQVSGGTWDACFVYEEIKKALSEKGVKFGYHANDNAFLNYVSPNTNTPPCFVVHLQSEILRRATRGSRSARWSRGSR